MGRLRILHIGNPANVAGEIASAQRKLGHDATVAVARPHPCGYDHDRLLRLPRGLRWLEVRGYDVLHLHSFRLLPQALETLLPGKIVLHHHGTDVRLPGEPWGARWAHARLCNYDLLRACPGAQAVPLPIDAEAYEKYASGESWGVPYVLHREMNPDSSGTRFVAKSCRKLSVHYGPHCNLTRGCWLWRMGASTVVVGKVSRISGMPGMTCMEAMAMGKPALCWFSDYVKHFMPECPVVSVNPETLEDRLREVLSSKILRQELGERGQAYVRRFHRPEDVAKQCLEAYA